MVKVVPLSQTFVGQKVIPLPQGEEPTAITPAPAIEYFLLSRKNRYFVNQASPSSSPASPVTSSTAAPSGLSQHPANQLRGSGDLHVGSGVGKGSSPFFLRRPHTPRKTDSMARKPVEEDDPATLLSSQFEDQCFLVATNRGNIIIYGKKRLALGASQSDSEEKDDFEESAKVDVEELYRFQTANQKILEIHYSPATHHIVTLEKESDKSVINVARIYQEWFFEDEDDNENNQPGDNNEEDEESNDPPSAREPTLHSSSAKHHTTHGERNAPPRDRGSSFSEKEDYGKPESTKGKLRRKQSGTGSPVSRKSKMFPTSPNIHVAAPPEDHFKKKKAPLMFQLPSPSSIRTLAVCPATGKIVTALKTSLNLWSEIRTPSSTLVSNSNNNSNNNNNNMGKSEKILEIFWMEDEEGWEVGKLDLFNEYLAFSIGRDVRVFKFVLSQFSQDQAGEQNLKRATFFNNENSNVKNNNNNLSSSIHNSAEFGSSNNLQQLSVGGGSAKRGHKKTSSRNLLDLLGSFSRPALPAAPQNFTKEDPHFFQVTFDSSHMSIQDKNRSHTFQLVPPSLPHPLQSSEFSVLGPVRDQLGNLGIRVDHDSHFRLAEEYLVLHQRFPETVAAIHSIMLVEERSKSATAVKCLIGTPRRGYLYRLCPSTALLHTYQFTSDATMISFQHYRHLFNLTPAMLEIHTIRPAFAEVPPFPPPCLVGMVPIIGLMQLIVSGNFVVVLSKFLSRAEEEKKTKVVPPTQGKPALKQEKNTPKKEPAAPLSTSVEKDKPTNRFGTPLLTSKSAVVVEERRNERSLARDVAPKFEGYNLYVFKTPTLSNLLEEILTNANAQRENDPSHFYTLTLESYFLLDSRISQLLSRLHYISQYFPQDSLDFDNNLTKDIEEEIHHTLQYLKILSGRLADYLVEIGDFEKAAQFFVTSNYKVSHVVTKFKDATKYLVPYLDCVLFDKDFKPVLDESEDLGNKVISIYFDNVPEKVAQVILESQLSTFSARETISKLETLTWKTQQTKVNEKEANINNNNNNNNNNNHNTHNNSSINDKVFGADQKEILAKALVFIRGKMVDEALAALKSLDTLFLTEYCIDHPDWFLQNGVGQFLRLCLPWLLLDILTQLDPAKLKLDRALSILTTQNHQTKILVMCYFEFCLSEHTNSKKELEMATRLAQLYAAHLGVNDLSALGVPSKEDENSAAASTPLLASKWIKFHQLAFQQRPVWLNQLPPLFADTSSNLNLTGSMSANSGSSSSAPIMTALSGGVGTRSRFLTSSLSSPNLRCAHFYLRKLQGLLCNAEGVLQEPALLDVASIVLKFLHEEEEQREEIDDPPNAESVFTLRLLCLSVQERFEEALQLLLGTYPNVALDYGQQYCRSAAPLWEVLLRQLVRCLNAAPLESAPTTATSGPPRHAFLHVYEEILKHLSKVLPFDAFLALLPDDGKMSFFFQFIERAALAHKSHLLQQSNVEPLSK